MCFTLSSVRSLGGSIHKYALCDASEEEEEEGEEEAEEDSPTGHLPVVKSPHFHGRLVTLGDI